MKKHKHIKINTGEVSICTECEKAFEPVNDPEAWDINKLPPHLRANSFNDFNSRKYHKLDEKQ